MTASFLIVFLTRFLLQCMDVEANPGPPGSQLFNKLEEHIAHLNEFVHVLADRCLFLERKCERFSEWMEHFDGFCQNADENIDRLETF